MEKRGNEQGRWSMLAEIGLIWDCLALQVSRNGEPVATALNIWVVLQCVSMHTFNVKSKSASMFHRKQWNFYLSNGSRRQWAVIV